MFESILSASGTETSTLSISNLLSVLATALVLGVIISLVYTKFHKNKMPSQSFALTLVILPAVITIIILLVGNSVARAFSLAGAFSITRFRSVPGDPKDITYVLFSMAVGLACGMGFLLYALIAALVLCAVMMILEVLKFGKPKGNAKLLKITIPENLDFQNAFDDVLKQYTASYQLLKVKTADLGSLYELDYRITSRGDTNEKHFIDDLRCRNGNLNISLILDVPQNEF